MAFGALIGTPLTGSNTNPLTGISATGSIVVSAGQLIVANYALRSSTTAVTGFTDNLGNTYTLATAPHATANANTTIGWSIVTNAGTLTTVTGAHASTSSDAGVMAAVFDGPYTASPVDSNPNNVADNTSPYDCPSTGTLSQASELVIGTIATGNGATPYSTTAPFTQTASAGTGTGANSCTGAMCHLVVSSTSAVAPQFTSATSNSSELATITFKAGTVAAFIARQQYTILQAVKRASFW